MRATLDEVDARAGNEIPHGRRDQHLTRPSFRADPRADVYSDAAYSLLDEFDLAGVNPGPYCDPLT